MKADGGRERVQGDTSKSNWLLERTKEVHPFAKFEIIPPLFCYLPDRITNNYIKIVSSMINKILWIDSRMCWQIPFVTERKV